MEVTGVGEELAGVDEVFIDVVEVSQQHFAPVDEIVERLLAAAAFYIDMVEQEKHL